MNGAKLTANAFALGGFLVAMVSVCFAGFFAIASLYSISYRQANAWLAALEVLACGYGMFFLVFMLRSYAEGMFADSRKEPDGFNNLDNDKMRNGMYQ